VHSLLGEGLTDASGTAPGCDDNGVSRLSSADDSRNSSPDPIFSIDFVALDEICTTSVEEEYWEASGYVNSAQFLELDDDPTNDSLDYPYDDEEPVDTFCDPHAHILCSLTSMTLPSLSDGMSDSELLTACSDALDPALRALHALDIRVHAMKTNRAEIYAQLRNKERLLHPDAPPRAHMDGGAMTGTTNRLDLLWHIQWIPEGKRVATLKVANNTPHYPTVIGYLPVPTNDSVGYRMSKCYFTPTLPATILSPDSMGKQFGCRGYTSLSSFVGGECNVHLFHCKRISEDVMVPLMLIRGLLYTRPLVLPSTKADRYDPLPLPVLHVRRVDTSSAPSLKLPAATLLPMNVGRDPSAAASAAARVPPVTTVSDNDDADNDHDVADAAPATVDATCSPLFTGLCSCCAHDPNTNPYPSDSLSEKLLYFH
jgi:hypothetical protein